MSNCTFQAQLVSVVEILATAAVAEMNRRVDDGCAIIRLELSRSRRDIDALKRKCQLMENELRRTRGRAKKRGCFYGVSERYSLAVKGVCVRDRSSNENTVTAPEDAQLQPSHTTYQQTLDLGTATESLLIKKEGTEEEQEVWSRGQDRSPFHPREINLINPAVTDTKPHRSGEQTDLIDSGLSHTNHSQLHQDLHKQEQADHDRPEVPIKQEKEETTGGDEGDRRTLDVHVDEQDAPMFSSTVGPGDYVTGGHTHSLPVLPPPANARTSWKTQGALSSTGYMRDKSAVQLGVGTEDGGGESSHVTRCADPVQACTGLTVDVGRRSHPHLTHPVIMVEASSRRQKGLRLWRAGGAPSTVTKATVGKQHMYSCSFCQKSFVRLSQLKEHLRSHTGEKPFSCMQCGRRFTKHCNLIRHAVVHSGEKPYRCVQCGKCFTQSSSLKSHQRTHMVERGLAGLPCGVGLELHDPEHLRSHGRKHAESPGS
ncbi:putative zinc finger and SCAN domain-containing protein 5C isoform X2 [Denticeps clupeoides]|uniref:putative zinc finger and SCAN domain-containing protein 5C isoform X2 n=1 Tax=Denticeps clupeoides TaxID=299321 RepID=UPI0010A2F1D1|nr:putative zinc finger and SCAN domain-containing protein 5C isoform X2 [Denticeps clupeoides]